MWTNLINGMWYIGSHQGTPDDGYLASGILINRAFKKYGMQNFKRDIIDQSVYFREMEEFYLKSLNAANNPQSYNMKNTAIGGWNHIHSNLENTQKRLKSLVGRIFPPESREKLRKPKTFRDGINPRKGQCGHKLGPASEERKAKVSKAHTGMKRTPEHCLAISLSKKGKPSPNKGKFLKRNLNAK